MFAVRFAASLRPPVVPCTCALGGLTQVTLECDVPSFARTACDRCWVVLSRVIFDISCKGGIWEHCMTMTDMRIVLGIGSVVSRPART